MKYLFFRKVPYDYGAEYQQFVNGVRQRGIGAYEDGDAEILLELHGDKVEEITEQDYLAYKKKIELGSNKLSGIQDATPRPVERSECGLCKRRKQPVNIA